jgi:hypothetical protein
MGQSPVVHFIGRMQCQMARVSVIYFRLDGKVACAMLPPRLKINMLFVILLLIGPIEPCDISDIVLFSFL